MEQIPFSGSVIGKSDDGRILINRGANYNMSPGMVLKMTTAGKELIDPETGAVLGREDGKPLGDLKIEEVKEKFSYCSMVVVGDVPEPGTLVYFPPSSSLPTPPVKQAWPNLNTQED